MSDVIQMASERNNRPAYVRFERIAKEDKQASEKAGHYVAKDIDLALITPPYSKDIFKQVVADWIAQNEREVSAGRLPAAWHEAYKNQYRLWQNGQEMPLNGSPIKGWGVISPAQQETLIRMNVLTVEDLAAINDEGVKRIGMGAADLKNKAHAWLAQLKDKGPLTQEMATVQSQNRLLASQVETLTQQVEQLTQLVRQNAQQVPQPAGGHIIAATITASDILGPEL